MSEEIKINLSLSAVLEPEDSMVSKGVQVLLIIVAIGLLIGLLINIPIFERAWWMSLVGIILLTVALPLVLYDAQHKEKEGKLAATISYGSLPKAAFAVFAAVVFVLIFNWIPLLLTSGQYSLSFWGDLNTIEGFNLLGDIEFIFYVYGAPLWEEVVRWALVPTTALIIGLILKRYAGLNWLTCLTVGLLISAGFWSLLFGIWHYTAYQDPTKEPIVAIYAMIMAMMYSLIFIFGMYSLRTAVFMITTHFLHNHTAWLLKFCEKTTTGVIIDPYRMLEGFLSLPSYLIVFDLAIIFGIFAISLIILAEFIIRLIQGTRYITIVTG